MAKRTTRKVKDKSHIRIILIAVLALFLMLGGRWYLLMGHQLPEPSGGPFVLTDHTGQTRSDKDFLGSYVLIYFGYTHCPDVCPISLQAASDILDNLAEDQASQIIPVMITVDPERDTPERMADYVKLFHPRTVGLTGTPEQIIEVSKAYDIIAEKSGSDVEYLIDHTSMFVFIGPDGAYITRFSSLADPETTASRIQSLMDQKTKE